MFKASCCLFWASKKPAMADEQGALQMSRVLFICLLRSCSRRKEISAAGVLCSNATSELACCSRKPAYRSCMERQQGEGCLSRNAKILADRSLMDQYSKVGNCTAGSGNLDSGF